MALEEFLFRLPHSVLHPRARAAFHGPKQSNRDVWTTRATMMFAPHPKRGTRRRWDNDKHRIPSARVCNTGTTSLDQGTECTGAIKNEGAVVSLVRCSSMEPNNPIDRVTTHAPSRTWRNNSIQRTENPKMANKANYEFPETPNGTATLTARCENIITDEGHF